MLGIMVRGPSPGPGRAGSREFCQDVPARPPNPAWPGVAVGGALCTQTPSCPLTSVGSLFSSLGVGKGAGVAGP